MDEPLHITVATEVAVIVGMALTVTVTDWIFTQPVVVLVPVTEYVVVTVLLNTVLAPVVVLRPVAGVQL